MDAERVAYTALTNPESLHKVQVIRSIEIAMKLKKAELKEAGQVLGFCTYGTLVTRLIYSLAQKQEEDAQNTMLN